MPKTKSVVMVLSHSTFVDITYPQLSLKDLLSLELVCKATYYSVRAWKPVGWNINSFLSRFFQDTLAFRALQASTGALIMGPGALRFFERDYTGTDLSFAVPCQHLLTFVLWLDKQGYIYLPTRQQRQIIQSYNPDSVLPLSAGGVDGGLSIINPEVQQCFELVSKWRTAEELSIMIAYFEFTTKERKEHLVRIKTIPSKVSLLSIVLACQNTLMMNLISHEAAYSLFPNATFLRKTCLTHTPLPRAGTHAETYTEYRARGYNISSVPSPSEWDAVIDSNESLGIDQTTGIRFGFRTISDRFTWRIPLPRLILDEGVRKNADLDTRYLEASGFTFSHDCPQELFPDSNGNVNEDLISYPDWREYIKYKGPVISNRTVVTDLAERILVISFKHYHHLQNFIAKYETFEISVEGKRNESWDEELLKVLKLDRDGKLAPLRAEGDISSRGD